MLLRRPLPPGPLHRLILPVLLAIISIAAVELAIQFIYHPSFWQKTTWLLHDPYHWQGEIPDRDFTYQKLRYVEDSDPEIISVGDSSGFFSIQSTIVNRYIGDHRYVSLNTGANQAYEGYEAIAEYMLRRSHHLRYVLLYIYPLYVPHEDAPGTTDLAPILHDDLVGVKARVTPPSAFLSPYAKSLIFAGRRFRWTEPLLTFSAGLQYWATAKESLGWLPEFDVRYDRVDGRVAFHDDRRGDWYHRLGFSDPSTINAVLDEFAAIVRRYGAQLAIMFGPVPNRVTLIGDPNIPIAEAALARFQREHPEVKFLSPFITRWGSEKFGMFNHISREYSFLSSERVGKALARLLTDPSSIRPFSPSNRDPEPYPTIAARPTGAADGKLLDAALALYMYASTADDSYRDLISTRVLNLLDQDPAFRYMMEDAHARTRSLAQRGITIGVDSANLQAIPVAVTGLHSCTEGPNIQWAQLQGNMFFSYKSASFDTSAPVPWPAAAHILIPTSTEGGVRKFDGYCPEASMSGAMAALR